MMLFLEKLENESCEELRVYTEALVCATHADTAAKVSEMLPFYEWRTLLRAGVQIQLMGKTFCSFEWFALRIWFSLYSLIIGGMIPRDAIVVYQRSPSVQEVTDSGSLDSIVLAFLCRGGKAKRLTSGEVLAALPTLAHRNIIHRIGRDLDDEA